MNYQETLDYLYSQLPMYQRIGGAAYKVNLDNTIALCNILNNPQNKFQSIHVAGTNGKGSTSHMLASILHEAGYKVGLYTSPHLKDFRERVKINGNMISEEEVTDFVSLYQRKFEDIHLSFFEWTVGLAFNHFAKHKVDIAVIETGMGGRLDSTNVITPLVSAITNIGLDHTQFLGNDLTSIAKEKAGIIKDNVPVVIGETQTETTEVFVKTAKKRNSNIYFADQLNISSYSTDLKGSYQTKNIKTVIATISQLAQLKISNNNIIQGLNNVIRNTGLLGRWQELNSSPLTICDTAHNESGIQFVVNQLKTIPHDQLHMVIGMVKDKSIDGVLSLLPKNAKYYFCQPNIPRALDAVALKNQATNFGLDGKVYASVKEAESAANNSAKSNDLIYIGGSTFVVAEIL